MDVVLGTSEQELEEEGGSEWCDACRSFHPATTPHVSDWLQSQALNPNVPQNHGWIKTSERLPDRQRRYLVKERGVGDPFILEFRTSTFAGWFEDGVPCYRPITHWQPLPPLPEE